jgi:hypothetical protein
MVKSIVRISRTAKREEIVLLLLRAASEGSVSGVRGAFLSFM